MLNLKSLRKSMYPLLTVLTGLSLPALGWTHGGSPVEFDDCRIAVANHWVHFTAYTPTPAADREFCKRIPDLGMTNLVFDYEGKLLRNMSVEFEITKEPEGTRVYHQEPNTYPTGSVNALVDFNQFGAGDYLAHIQLVNAGDKIDAHMPFSVGTGTGISTGVMVFAVALGLIGTALYLMVPALKTRANFGMSARNTNKSGHQPKRGGKLTG